MTENQKVELYNRIDNLSKHNKLNLCDLREDFVTEIWLLLYETEYEKLTDYYIWKVMMRQRYATHLRLYKKLFYYEDNKCDNENGHLSQTLRDNEE